MTPIEEIVMRMTRTHALGLTSPCRVTCPTDQDERGLMVALSGALREQGTKMEVVDLRPAPGQRLEELTERLWEFTGSGSPPQPGPTGTLLIVIGIELLEGPGNDAPTYPFRSRFQFDEQFAWLFLGRDRSRLTRLFENYSYPLYHAASEITPKGWRAGQ